MNHLISDVLRGMRFTFFPRRCPFCGRVIAPTDTVCGKCGDATVRVRTPICFTCGRSREHCTCSNSRAHNRYVTAFAAPFYYMGNLRRTILRMKFSREPENAQVLGDEMALFASQVFSDVSFDLVTFVPMTDKEMRSRGYNQSALLAQQAAKKLQLPCKAVLSKLYETAPQRSLTRLRRSGNVLGVFDVPSPGAAEGKRILLCDDVCTSGATLTECAKMLCIAGAREVFCLTAAVGCPQA